VLAHRPQLELQSCSTPPLTPPLHPQPHVFACAARYGTVESVRLRSIPVKLDVAMPRRAAVLTGKVDTARATAHAYIVFSTPEAAEAALVQNMQVVRRSWKPQPPWPIMRASLLVRATSETEVLDCGLLQPLRVGHCCSGT